jgi:hypothetical protein
MLAQRVFERASDNPGTMAIIARLKSTIEKQDATNARQEGQIEALTSGLQKVNARLEMSRPAPQVAESNY